VLVTTNFNCAFRNLQTSSYVTRVHTNFSSNKVEWSLIEYITNITQSTCQNLKNLFQVVRLIYQPIVSYAWTNFALHSLRQIHRICNSDYQKSWVLMTRPIEQIVKQCLLLREECIKLVNQNNPHFITRLLQFFVFYSFSFSNSLLQYF